MRRRRAVVTAVVVLATGAGGGVAATEWSRGTGGPVPAARAGIAVETAQVRRADLSTAQELPGALGYGVPRTLRAASGTVTWLPAVGAVVRQGGVLYRNDDHPVVALYGNTPLFRPLGAPGLTGRDVRVLVDNLRDLGYRVGDQPPDRAQAPVRRGDGVLTARTIRAVRAWQRDTGLPVTGVVGPSDVVVLPGPVRVSRLLAQPGDSPANGVLAVTGRRKVVVVRVEVGDLGPIRPGLAVRVELPGGRTGAGKVTRVDRDARAAEPDDADVAAAEVDVTVSLTDTKAVRNLDSAPVRVSFTGEVRKGVLAVPVAALLALREGGHAVQVAGGPLVAVETGMFAMGLVEVSAEGLAAGTEVVIAA